MGFQSFRLVSVSSEDKDSEDCDFFLLKFAEYHVKERIFVSNLRKREKDMELPSACT